ncbi:bifunctional diaminohydroxyphosphoribosylaminopyrimidine deaminase/5-amino-6-(5-phosphoribosylamino)uracil reductase RibD [Candidatus Peregrinibacteria bacterium]|nr:bifunctional diaminohydroxyphosphoribosylaminopyrimidine deaminase/5-amino-6-(5-phosphoribosylamino)uracil reductase RibD [Candidatus Peregrinibacteria bacterium]
MKSEEFMKRAAKLATRGMGFTKTNPLVGALLVKDGVILGKAWHERFGGHHAEVEAVYDAEKKGYSVLGAHLFVTLEPCFHYGKTPPCVDFLLEKGISKVSVLFRDKNPLVSGKSIKKLQSSGVEVDENFLELREKYADMYEIFFFSVQKKLPFTALKLAMSENLCISDGAHTQTKITGKETDKHVHFLRQKYDAILVGARTVFIDNPHLGVRYGEFFQGKRDPLRILLDPHLRIPINSQVFRDENFLVVVFPENEKIARKKFGKRVLVIEQGETRHALSLRQFDLRLLQKELYARDIGSILVEGGKRTAEEFLSQKCVQKGYFSTSPKTIIGEKTISVEEIFKNPAFHLQKERKFGVDTLFEGKYVF